MSKTLILGGGVTGVAAGMISQFPVLEAADRPGGISTSYDKAGYSFSPGGGHWLFAKDPLVLRFLGSLCDLKRYERKASVFFADTGEFVPYPIQHQDKPLAGGYLQDQPVTMAEWLLNRFGPKLCDLFFFPFHELYTAGLYEHIAPQDSYKSPGNNSRGYNVTFAYPVEGLDVLAQRMATRCKIAYGNRVTKIAPEAKYMELADGSTKEYDNLISTLPLNRMLELTGLSVASVTDPHVSVHVLNIGARRGSRCPDDHWLYIPQSRSGFHRVGFYSNVSESFVPSPDRVGLYVERAYRGVDPIKPEVYELAVARELQDWGFIDEVEVMDSTWIDVAYTYSWPNSRWREEALALLEQHRIYQVGRYGRWHFQGIIESIREGLIAGASFSTGGRHERG